MTKTISKKLRKSLDRAPPVGQCDTAPPRNYLKVFANRIQRIKDESLSSQKDWAQILSNQSKNNLILKCANDDLLRKIKQSLVGNVFKLTVLGHTPPQTKYGFVFTDKHRREFHVFVWCRNTPLTADINDGYWQDETARTSGIKAIVPAYFIEPL